MFVEIDDIKGRVMADTIESCLRKVTTKVLGHEATPDELKDFTMFTCQTDPNIYLSYKGKGLGVITHDMNFSFDKGNVYTVRFEPI